MATSSQTFSASGTFTWPAGIRWVTVECYGSGGAGGAGTGNPAAGGGGAGGAYARKVLARPSGGTDTVTVGGSVTGNTTNTQAQNNGNASWFRANDATGCVAEGGQGGAPATTNSSNGSGGTGSSSSSIGDQVFAGGNGSAGVVGSTNSGAGGGGAGSTGAGGNASGTTQGTGTAVGGQDGAAGRTTAGAGNSVTSNIGGGGGGGMATNATDRAGGSSGPGQVIVSWNPQQLNNYLGVSAGDGLSVSEKIR